MEFEKPKYKMVKFQCRECGKIHENTENTLYSLCECRGKTDKIKMVEEKTECKRTFEVNK